MSEEQRQKAAQEAIEEARMVLPGIQALFGFQLIAVLHETFKQLPPAQQRMHFFAVVLIALAIALIMTPAAYHRQVEPGSASAFFVKLASGCVACAMLPLAIALSIELYLVGTFVVSEAVALGVAIGMFVAFVGLWFGFPRMVSKGRPRAR